MAITFLQALNRTLVRLRETEVASTTGNSNYVTLITQFVNEAHEEVEEACAWNYQNATATISVVSGTNTYALTGWGDNAAIETVYDTNKVFTLQGPVPNETIDNLYNTGVAGTDTAYYWTVYGVDSSGDLQIKLYPNPTTSSTIKVLGRKKQGWLSGDSTNILCPWLPVVDLAYAKAVSERGEDGGVPYDEAYAHYINNLARAVATDAALGHKDYNWKV